MKQRILALTLTAALLLGLCACTGQSGQSSSGSAPASGSGTAAAAVSQRASFLSAAAPLYDTTLVPNAPTYTVADDFSNVSNYSQFSPLPDAEAQLLRTNGFYVSSDYGSDEFFSIYENDRYNYIPNFVTTDSMMHTYHLYFSRLLKSVEKEHFIAALTQISQTMQTESMTQLAALKGTDWENAAKRNAAFFSVALSLLQPDAQVPAEVSDVVQQELSLISGAAGITESPVMNLGGASGVDALQEDYSQYIPRGYYAASDDLSRYFKAMMWYGRLTFRAADDDQSRSALLLTEALENSDALKSWEEIYTITSFFVGASDDSGIYEYAPLIQSAYGGWPKAADLPKLDKQWKTYAAAVAKLEAPVINSIPIYDATIQPDKEAAVKGFRFMGQRFTLDASIFQSLVYRAVDANAAGEQRMLPSALDVPAALGSTAARKVLTDAGADGYKNYPENMASLQKYFASAPDALWTGSLYAGWLNTLRPLTETKGAGYPPFMQNEAWALKDVNTFLGSWTELKHDSILYAKQVYAEMGGGPADEIDDRGYVEPEPVLFGRLSQLSQATSDGLAAYGVLDDADKDALGLMADLAKQLMTISEKELRGEALTDAEYDLIRTYGGQLEHFWTEALRDETGAGELTPMNYPAAVVADVATDPNGSVLEEGTGYIKDIYVIVSVEGSLRIAHGGVYSYYEFTQPIDQRLTDEAWRAMMGIQPDESGGWAQTPTVQVPAWTQAFYAPSNYGA